MPDRKEILDFICDTVRAQMSNNKVLMHYTRDKGTALSILKEGFRYSEYYEYSSVEISPDPIDISYKYDHYKVFGNFLIIICIPRFLLVNSPCKGSCKGHDPLYSLGLCECFPDCEQEYLLRSAFVYGYIDLENLELCRNEGFGALRLNAPSEALRPSIE